jgi:hypothetical protein
MHLITWTERDGRHVSYANDHQAALVIDMISNDPSMTLVSVETR